ncbi:MAG: rubrerythrin family protein [Oscillospiraceae bacterium]
MNIKGTKSEENIKKALFGESVARNKYTYFAQKAKEEGNETMANLFERMATNEMNHAKIWFKVLNGIGTTNDNLKTAATGEYEEWTSMYPSFAKTAREEGLEDLAKMFEKVAEIEKDHERQFLLAFAKNSNLNNEEPKTKKGYRCVFCGASFEERQDVCPVCEAIGSFEECEIKA